MPWEVPLVETHVIGLPEVDVAREDFPAPVEDAGSVILDRGLVDAAPVLRDQLGVLRGGFALFPGPLAVCFDGGFGREGRLRGGNLTRRSPFGALRSPFQGSGD